DFIEATRWIKANLPGARVSGGVSNISFSFRGNNAVREAMHAAFLFHAIRAGLDMGIVNAGQLAVYEEIKPELRERVEDVLLNRRDDATERLVEFAESVKAKDKTPMKGEVHDIGKNIVGVVLQCNNYDVVDLGVMVPAAKILETAREKKADAIGLSGLITPSLDEMVHVAQEMEREGFDLPLLIGGATTSRAHTAVKIAPHYRASTVHVVDASRAVGVVNSLLNEQLKSEFAVKTRSDYAQLREDHSAKTRGKKLLMLEEARANRAPIDWSTFELPRPEFTGARAVCPSI